MFAIVEEYEMTLVMQEGARTQMWKQNSAQFMKATNLSASSALHHTSCSTTPTYIAIQAPLVSPNNCNSMQKLWTHSTHQQQNEIF
jgi:hypothetical protein